MAATKHACSEDNMAGTIWYAQSMRGNMACMKHSQKHGQRNVFVKWRDVAGTIWYTQSMRGNMACMKHSRKHGQRNVFVKWRDVAGTIWYAQSMRGNMACMKHSRSDDSQARETSVHMLVKWGP
eukprot:1160376-Pelagomonas_calceolata.AAC.5